MPETKSCPKCGSALPADAPGGICPGCLMQAGLASGAVAGTSGENDPTRLVSGFVPPEPNELAAHFPQLEILELLGKGGMGAVYKARQKNLDRLVAVKILPPQIGDDPAFAERFAREARALAKLSHQNIVAIFDFGQVDGLYYFIMEFVDGVNLRQASRTESIEPGQALAVVPQICAALQFAHDEGIVHRDIKPENILIDKRGRVKIADFGLAKLLGTASLEVMLTGTHQIMGTLHYMAPEQMQGSRGVDHRADIYSLGVVFYEMLTGQLPLGRFEPPSKKVAIDVRLDDIVLRSLEAEPDRRYQHASDVKTDVESITHVARTGTFAPTAERSHSSATTDNAGSKQVLIPAIGLLIAGAIDCSLLFCALLFVEFAGLRMFSISFLEFAILFLVAIVGIVKIHGAICLLKQKSPRFAQAAAIVALLPVSPSALVGLPAGIWALVAMNRSGRKWGVAGSKQVGPETAAITQRHDTPDAGAPRSDPNGPLQGVAGNVGAGGLHPSPIAAAIPVRRYAHTWLIPFFLGVLLCLWIVSILSGAMIWMQTGPVKSGWIVLGPSIALGLIVSLIVKIRSKPARFLVFGVLLMLVIGGAVVYFQGVKKTEAYETRIASVRRISNPSTRDEMLTTIALEAAGSGEADIVRQAIFWIGNGNEKDKVLLECAVKLAAKGHRTAADEFIFRIVQPETRDAALKRISELP